MFKKLLGNLPFNPSLIGQVSFYARRVHREATVRKAGLIMLVLAMCLQMLAVASPPQASLASSTSDIITGGFSTKDSGVQNCEKNIQHYQEILGHFGIDCAALKQSTIVSVSPNDHDKRLYSMGRLAYGTAGETPITVPGTGTFYLRHFWSLNHKDSYKALKVTAKDGNTVYVLFDCGNLVFIGVPKPPKICAYDKNLLASDSKCFEPCPVAGKSSLPKNSPECYQPCPYNKAIAANSPKCFEPCTIKGKTTLPKTSAECFVPCPYNSNIRNDSAQCKPCEQSQTREDLTACLEYHKTAGNTTQAILDANGTTAKAGDVIEYTLQTTNKGKVTVKNYVVNENISDVLDYADVVDLMGGTKNQDMIVSWPAKDIKAGETLTQKFTVRIKSPIPSTPVSSSDAAHYDMTMTNVYGNAVSIKLPPSVIKVTETVVQRLPNTGPGSSMIVIFALTSIAAYFFARTRLFGQELDIVRSDFASGAQ